MPTAITRAASGLAACCAKAACGGATRHRDRIESRDQIFTAKPSCAWTFPSSRRAAQMAMNELVRPAEKPRTGAARAHSGFHGFVANASPVQGRGTKNVMGLGYILLSDAAHLHASMRGLGSRVRNP